MTNTSCVLVKDTGFSQTTNDETTNLGMKNVTLSWAGDSESLQRIVINYMKFDGKWNSPVEEKKVCSDCDTPSTCWKKESFF